MSNIDFTNEENIIYIRISYSIVQTITLFIYLFFYLKISSLPFNINEEKFDVVEPTTGEIMKMNSQEYDLYQLKQLRNQTLTSFAIILFLHLKWGFIQPLFMQSLLGLSSLLSNPLVRVYIFGELLKRPWTDPETENPFKRLISSFQEMTKEEEIPEEKKDEKEKGKGKKKHSKDNTEESETQETEENTQESETEENSEELEPEENNEELESEENNEELEPEVNNEELESEEIQESNLLTETSKDNSTGTRKRKTKRKSID